MELFDRLIVNDAVTKVVDLWHVSYAQFFSLTETTGFFQEARSRCVHVVVLLMMDQNGRFAAEFKMLLSRRPDLDAVLVEDEALTTISADELRPVAKTNDRKLVLPRLDTELCQLLNQPEFLSERFVRGSVAGAMTELQARMRAALLPVFEHFHALVVAGDLGMPVQTLLRQHPRLPL
jgi:hypothetical protein